MGAGGVFKHKFRRLESGGYFRDVGMETDTGVPGAAEIQAQWVPLLSGRYIFPD